MRGVNECFINLDIKFSCFSYVSIIPMQIVHYPHPALRFKSVDVQQIDGTLRKVVRKMFDLMYEANGIGLAANQVGLPFRFFIVNLNARPGNEDEELVFINPVLSKRKGDVVGEEGCLSLPGLYGDVQRAETITIEAFDLSGQGFAMDLDDLPARVVQHDTDHLDGIMFTDHIKEGEESDQAELELLKFVKNFRDAQADKLFVVDEALQASVQAMADSGKISADFLSTPVHKLTPPEINREE